MREGDLTKYITVDEALLQVTIKAALNGDHRARRDLFTLKREAEQQARFKEQLPDPFSKLSEDDQAIIDDFFERRTSGSDHNGR